MIFLGARDSGRGVDSGLAVNHALERSVAGE